MKVLLHLGFPKTGSSNLQFVVWKPLHERGVINLKTWRFEDPSEHLNKRPSSRLFNYKKILPDYLNFDDKKLNVLSDESFTAPKRLRRNNFGSKIEDPKNFPQKIKDQILSKYPKANIEVLIILRNHKDLIFSQYVEEYNLKKYKNIELVFESDEKTIDLDGFDIYQFNKYIDIISQTYGDKNVTVLFFEQLKANPDYFFHSLSRLSNTSNEFVSEAFKKNRLNSKMKNKIGYMTKDGETLIPYFNSKQKNDIVDYFYQDTKLLIERFENSINLSKLGYNLYA